MKSFLEKLKQLKRPKWYNSESVGFILAVSLCIYSFLMLAIPPYHWGTSIVFAVVGLLFLELSVYRYWDWKPEKSPLFNKVMLGVAHLIVEKKTLMITLDDKTRYTVKVTKTENIEKETTNEPDRTAQSDAK